MKQPNDRRTRHRPPDDPCRRYLRLVDDRPRVAEERERDDPFEDDRPDDAEPRDDPPERDPRVLAVSFAIPAIERPALPRPPRGIPKAIPSFSDSPPPSSASRLTLDFAIVFSFSSAAFSSSRVSPSRSFARSLPSSSAKYARVPYDAIS